MYKAFLIALIVIIFAGGFTTWYRSRHDSVQSPTATTTTTATDTPVTTLPSGTTTPVKPASTGDTLTLALGKSGTLKGVTITPTKLVSDSRCPQGVQCIWAGMVEVEATITWATGSSTQTFKVGTVATTSAATVTFVDASPYPKKGSTTAPADYRFVFEIK